jgi:hypothetical protein
MDHLEHDIYSRTTHLRSFGVTCVAMLVVLATFWPATRAEAGHYYIRDLEVYSLDLVIKLRDVGIQTTEHFIAKASTADDRAKLAKSVGMEEAEVLKFASICEFLQIDGVGPKVVTLLQSAGVVDVQDLAKRNATDLHARMLAVNRVEKITGVDAPVELVESWIVAARKVKYRVTK